MVEVADNVVLKTEKKNMLKTDAILNLNIQCLRNKLDLLDFVLCSVDYKLICITEHWMSDDELKFLNIKNYKVASAYSRKNVQHGGTLILTRDDAETTQIS